ncbi:MAG: gliding motility-associated C-terminal domain-containing protein [Cyclobacteriaceae bacterium]
MLKYCFFLFFMSLGFILQAQVCDGNFGNNIFESGDFGTGPSQTLPFDPEIAPGYIYTTDLPPSDGYYTVTNYMGPSQVYGDWLAIGDKSTDPKGYMMVVNASNEPGLFYEQTINGLCEDVLYEFSVDIINLIRSWSTDRIFPDVSFLLDGEVVYNTGNIPNNETWINYGFTFSTQPGQTQMVLSLRNNAPGGLGNDLALDNITFRPCGAEALILPETIADICEDGEPFEIAATIVGSAFDNTFIQWQQSFDEGETWVNLTGETSESFRFDNLKSGLYYYRYLLADTEEKLQNEKCRTFSNTKIVQVIPKFIAVSDSLCTGNSLLFGGLNISTSGTYIDSLQNKIGCDSIVTLNLAFVENVLDGKFIPSDPSCQDSLDGSIEIVSLTSSGPYQIDQIDFVKFPPWNVENLGADDYPFTITDKYGCQLDTTITLTNPPAFEVDLGADQSLILGQFFDIKVSLSAPAVSYEWNPRSIDCEPPCQFVRELFFETDTVSLTAISTDGCVGKDDVIVTIDGLYDPFIPNVFTPNGDGKNEFFTVFPAEIDAIESITDLSIYTRDGKKIFEKKLFKHGVPELGWNGKRNGQDLPYGVYFYSTNVLLINGQSRTYTGHLTLLR